MRTEDLPAAELVTAAMEVLDASNASQLADALGMTRRNEDRRVRRWIDGLNEPNYLATLRLLVEVGLLPKELPERAAGKPWSLGRSRATTEARALNERELAAAIHEIADVLDRLRSLAGEQAQPRQGRRQGGA